VAAVVREILAAAVEAGEWASGVVVLAQSCDATSLQGFDVIRDPSLARAELGRDTSIFVVRSRSCREHRVLQTVETSCFAQRPAPSLAPFAQLVDEENRDGDQETGD